MKLITRNSDYAVRAICFMAREKKRVVSVSELVSELKIPRPFLRKILQILNKKGVLESYKGKGGGFKLAGSPKKIFLLDLIEIFQGPLKLSECIFKKSLCPNRHSCTLKQKLDVIDKYVIRELKSVTIASLLKKKGVFRGKKKNNKH